jgi:hypothetical protein
MSLTKPLPRCLVIKNEEEEEEEKNLLSISRNFLFPSSSSYSSFGWVSTSTGSGL